MNTTENQTTDNFAAFEPPSYHSPLDRQSASTPLNPGKNTGFSDALAGFGVFALSVALIIIVPLIALLGYVGIKYLTTKTADFDKDPMAIVVNLIAIIPAHLLTLAAVWAVATKNGQRPFWQSLKFKTISASGYLLCFLATIGLFAIAVGILYIFPEQENTMMKMLMSSPAAMISAALMATFTAPIVEETVYRGVLYQGFENWLGKTASVALVTLLFALVHVPQYFPSAGTILIILLLSLFLTILRAKTDNILPCVVIHTIFNGVQSVGLVYQAIYGVPAETGIPDPKAMVFPF